ncbi:hypothetical protein CROQUDRAFT_667131 [Cronartium quercuum f. sp. fusiforme G11]|uniref:Uncharacterized protein n=1 Tax=Cronartium quercuum f. sp. fusiforme G11 TaxID=708437 RepID=A0A9P6T501_9BASI|nr:hypothetical protein CROQUDRAFT_667131 [Cronartium quercuum f. sp. fusiforme G11]
MIRIQEKSQICVETPIESNGLHDRRKWWGGFRTRAGQAARGSNIAAARVMGMTGTRPDIELILKLTLYTLHPFQYPALLSRRLGYQVIPPAPSR